MQSDQFRRMLREQKGIVEEAFREVIDCDQLSSYQRTILCSQLLRELSLSSRKIAMTLRHKSRQPAPDGQSSALPDESNIILFRNDAKVWSSLQSTADKDREGGRRDDRTDRL